MRRILHIAPQNYAGVPYDFYRMHNASGDFSRLITLHKSPIAFPEDICLNFALPNFKLAKFWRKKKGSLDSFRPAKKAFFFQPRNKAEKMYFTVSDIFRKRKVNSLIRELDLDSFDIIHFDAGLDFYRNAAQAKKWKAMGKKIVCCYYGSDLRLRGLIKDVHELSDLNISSEFDHLGILDSLNYLFYPYDTSEVPPRIGNESKKVKVIHTPTNRIYKGTGLILDVIDQIRKIRNFEFLLLENMPRAEILDIKRGCDICIDQVGGIGGGTGYGKAGLETLAMGIPVITNMTAEYEQWLPENPFIVANNKKQLYDVLLDMIDNKDRREQAGLSGKLWVEKYHSYAAVNAQLYKLYEKYGIV